MNINLLRHFLILANKAGYASNDRKNWIKEQDGSTTIIFKKGNWQAHDNFFGGEPYGGRTVISFQGRAVWLMVYYGWVTTGQDRNQVYTVLRNGLRQIPPNFPCRGPRKYLQGNYLYTNIWQGSIKNFWGQEKIKYQNQIVYQAKYLGGLVDQNKGI